MLKIFLFLSLCFCSTLMADSPPAPEPENLQAGRYQMIKGEGIHLYLLDTATGYVWKSKAKSNWLEPDSWELQITTPPEQP